MSEKTFSAYKIGTCQTDVGFIENVSNEQRLWDCYFVYLVYQYM